MRPVIEEYKIRHVVDALPQKRFAGRMDGSEFPDCRTVRFGNPMTIHALFDRRDAGVARCNGCRMAIKTGYFQNAGMKLMRVRDRLHRLVAAHIAVGLGEPAHAKDGEQNGSNTDRKNKAGIIHQILASLLPSAAVPAETQSSLPEIHMIGINRHIIEQDWQIVNYKQARLNRSPGPLGALAVRGGKYGRQIPDSHLYKKDGPVDNRQEQRYSYVDVLQEVW